MSNVVIPWNFEITSHLPRNKDSDSKAFKVSLWDGFRTLHLWKDFFNVQCLKPSHALIFSQKNLEKSSLSIDPSLSNETLSSSATTIKELFTSRKLIFEVKNESKRIWMNRFQLLYIWYEKFCNEDELTEQNLKLRWILVLYKVRHIVETYSRI